MTALSGIQPCTTIKMRKHLFPKTSLDPTWRSHLQHVPALSYLTGPALNMYGLKDSPRIQKRNGTYLNINTMRLISTIEFLYESYILKTRQTLTSLPYSWWFLLTWHVLLCGCYGREQGRWWKSSRTAQLSFIYIYTVCSWKEQRMAKYSNPCWSPEA